METIILARADLWKQATLEWTSDMILFSATSDTNAEREEMEGKDKKEVLDVWKKKNGCRRWYGIVATNEL